MYSKAIILSVFVSSWQATNYGTETKTSGKENSDCLLNIAFINSTNIPDNEAQCRELGKKVASEIKHLLKNANEFNACRVLFVTQKAKGLVTTTNTTYYYYYYKQSEI